MPHYKYSLIEAQVLEECTQALSRVDAAQFDALVDAILGAEQVFLIGVGRVMLSLMAFAKRLNHLGIRAHCVGDIDEPALVPGDLLIIASGSGETLVPLAIAGKAAALGAVIVHIGSAPESSMSRWRTLFVRVPAKSRFNLPDEVPSQQPMTTLFEQSLLLLCDCVCMAVASARTVNVDTLWQYHANLE